MNDSSLVRGLERFRNVPCEQQRLRERHWTASQPVGERFALDQLHHEGVGSRRLLESVDVRDVWVVQGGEGFGLAFQPRHAVRVVGKAVRQHLDRDLAVQSRVACAKHLPHPSRAQRRENLVRADLRPNGEGHRADGG